jgi:hypothetical protein
MSQGFLRVEWRPSLTRDTLYTLYRRTSHYKQSNTSKQNTTESLVKQHALGSSIATIPYIIAKLLCE